jgi:hypothetical protein
MNRKHAMNVIQFVRAGELRHLLVYWVSKVDDR